MEHREPFPAVYPPPSVIRHPVPARAVDVENRRREPLSARRKKREVQHPLRTLHQECVTRGCAVEMHAVGRAERIEPDVEPAVVVGGRGEVVAPRKPALAKECHGHPAVRCVERNGRKELVPRLVYVGSEGHGLRGHRAEEVGMPVFRPLKPYDVAERTARRGGRIDIEKERICQVPRPDAREHRVGVSIEDMLFFPLPVHQAE